MEHGMQKQTSLYNHSSLLKAKRGTATQRIPAGRVVGSHPYRQADDHQRSEFIHWQGWQCSSNGSASAGMCAPGVTMDI